MLTACLLPLALFVTAGLTRGEQASGTTAAVPSAAPDLPPIPTAGGVPLGPTPPDSFEKASSEMGLNPEVALAFHDLVRARYWSLVEIDEQINGREFTTYQEIQRAYATANAKIDEKVKVLLSPQQYARYEFACEEAPYRKEVRHICVSLWRGGFTLTNATLEKLVSWTMTFYRQWGVNPDGADVVFFTTERGLDQYVQARARANVEIRRQAAEILPPEVVSLLERVQSDEIGIIKDTWYWAWHHTTAPASR